MNADLSIIPPLLVQAGLTFLLLFWMGRERFMALRSGDYIPNEPGARPTWKGRAGIVSNAFHNQLEMPMLFFVVAILAITTGAADAVMTALAWTYAVLRVIHAAIHTTYNKVAHRFAVYIASSVVLGVMWAKLGVHVLTAVPGP